MANNITPVSKMSFKLYPLNKSVSGVYSYYQASPILTFQFQENDLRFLKSNSLFLCGRLRIKNRNKENQPANRFDMVGENKEDSDAYEQVCYIDDRIGCNAFIDNVTVGDLMGSNFEQAKNYNRNLSSLIGATNSYKHLCSFSNMSLTACPNLDVESREVCSDIEFSLPLMNGFFRSNSIVGLDRGLEIKINLASDNTVLMGKDASNFIYELRNVFLAGDYLVSEKPAHDNSMNYVSYHNYQNVINSGNDHQNINLALSMVNNIYHNFIPATWSNNFKFSAFSTCPLMNYNSGTSDYEVANINRYTVSRGAIRFPLNYPVDESPINRLGGYQTIRSREYLNSIAPYSMIKSCLCSPDSEARDDMVAQRMDWNNTPQ